MVTRQTGSRIRPDPVAPSGRWTCEILECTTLSHWGWPAQGWDSVGHHQLTESIIRKPVPLGSDFLGVLDARSPGGGIFFVALTGTMQRARLDRGDHAIGQVVTGRWLPFAMEPVVYDFRHQLARNGRRWIPGPGRKPHIHAANAADDRRHRRGRCRVSSGARTSIILRTAALYDRRSAGLPNNDQSSVPGGGFGRRRIEVAVGIAEALRIRRDNGSTTLQHEQLRDDLERGADRPGPQSSAGGPRRDVDDSWRLINARDLICTGDPRSG